MIPRLALTGISKQYPAVKANDSVSLTVAAGQIHAVLGDRPARHSWRGVLACSRSRRYAPLGR